VRRLDLSMPTGPRNTALLEFFRVNSVRDPGTNTNRYVLPTKAFEEYAGIKIADHPLFFRPEIFAPGSDWNVSGDFHYLTIDGLFKAVTVLAVADLTHRRCFRGQN